MLKKSLVLTILLILFSGLVGCSGGGGSSHTDPDVLPNVVTEPNNTSPVVVKTSTLFVINTSNVTDSLKRSTASSVSSFGDNYKLTITRNGEEITKSNKDDITVTNNNGALGIEFSKVTTDGKLTSGLNGVEIGDIITLEVEGFSTQQFVITQSMIDLGANSVVLKAIDSRQTFTLENLTSGSDRVTARSSMGAKVYSTDKSVVFETLNKSIQLSFDTDNFNRLTQSISRLPQSNSNTQVTMDMTTVDPNLEDGVAIGDFTYNPTEADKRDTARSTMADSQSEDAGLESVVMANMEMKTSDGAKIDCFGGGDFNETTQTCSDGKTATLRMKVPASQFERYSKSYNNGSLVVPLYSYSQTQAKWIRQIDSNGDPINGELVLEDNDANQIANDGDTLYIVGKVGHFSYWNGDYPIQNTCLKGTINSSTSGIPIGTLIKAEGKDYSGRKKSISLNTDATSFDNLSVKKDAKVDIYIQYSDGSTAAHKIISTGDTSICQDVGTFDIDDGTKVTLTVQDQNGAKLNRAMINAAGSSKYTDENGSVDLVLFGSGTSLRASYYLDGYNFTTQKDINGSDTITIDTSIAEIKGNVTINENNTSFPASGASIYAYATDYSYYSYTKVDSNGSYNIRLPKTKVANHQDATIRVSYYDKNYAKYVYENVSKTLDKDETNTVDLNLTIIPITVFGRVTQKFATGENTGINGAYVNIGEKYAYTDSNGNYSLTFFKKTDNNITAYAYDYSSYKYSKTKTIELSDVNKSIDFVIDNRSSSITGKVINSKGVGIENVYVYWTGDWRSAKTDENGSFSIKTYTVEENNADYKVRAYLNNSHQESEVSLSALGETVDAGFLTFDTNTAPVIKSVNLDPVYPIAGKEFIVQIDANDIDGDDITYALRNRYRGYREATITQNKDNSSFTVTVDTTGSIYLLAEVTDDNGKSTTRDLSRYITANSIPYITSVTGMSNDYNKTFDMNITVSANDSDGDSLTYRFDLVDLKGTSYSSKLAQNNNNVIIDKSIANGSYKLNITVADGVNSRTVQKSFKADNNTKPIILDIYASIADGNKTSVKTESFYAKTSDNISLEANATDDSNDISYLWSVAGKESTDKIISLKDIVAGSYTGYLQVSDYEGLYDTAKFNLIIAENQKPIIDSIKWEPSIIVKGSDGVYRDGNDKNITDVTLKVEAHDPDKETLTYTFGNIDGAVSDGGARDDKSVTYKLSELKLGTHAVKVTISDGTNNVVRYPSFEIKQNTPPIIKAFYVPYTAKSGSTINVSTYAVDSENDDISYSWSTTSGKITNSTTTNASVELPKVENDTNVTISLKVDAGIDTVNRTRTILVKTNQSPIITSMRFYNTNVVVGDTVYVNATAYDKDGSIKSYEWLVDNTVVTTGEQTNFNTSNLSSGEHTVSLKVTDNDDKSTIETFTDKLTINQKNVSPVISNLTSTSLNLLPGKVANLSVTATDADADPLNITWTGVSSSDKDKATFSNSEIGTYTITAKVSDGKNTPVEKTITITVSSLTFSISPSKTSSLTGEEITISSSFSDNSVVSSAVTWSVIKPTGSNVDIIGNGSTATISPDIAGTYTVKAETTLYGVTYSKEVSFSSSQDIVGNVIEGVIKNENGDVLSGASIRLYNKADTSIYDQTLTSDDNGGYKFTDIPAGDYYLVVAGQDYIKQTQVVTVK